MMITNTQVKFENAYDAAIVKVLAYQRDFSKLTTSERANQQIDNGREMNKVFNDKLLAEGLGQHIDLTA